jgi:hypothetical protein
MTLARYANTRDTNEGPIRDTALYVGASWWELDTPCDGIVGYKGANYLIEVKLPPGPKGGMSHSELTPTQRKFHAEWRGQIAVVRSPLELLQVIGAVQSGVVGRGCR